MSAETLNSLWKDARFGLISEAKRIPEDSSTFRPTDQTRSVAEFLLTGRLKKLFPIAGQ